jgi:hypothetical protein
LTGEISKGVGKFVQAISPDEDTQKQVMELMRVEANIMQTIFVEFGKIM